MKKVLLVFLALLLVGCSSSSDAELMITAPVNDQTETAKEEKNDKYKNLFMEGIPFPLLTEELSMNNYIIVEGEEVERYIDSDTTLTGKESIMVQPKETLNFNIDDEGNKHRHIEKLEYNKENETLVSLIIEIGNDNISVSENKAKAIKNHHSLDREEVSNKMFVYSFGHVDSYNYNGQVYRDCNPVDVNVLYDDHHFVYMFDSSKNFICVELTQGDHAGNDADVREFERIFPEATAHNYSEFQKYLLSNINKLIDDYPLLDQFTSNDNKRYSKVDEPYLIESYIELNDNDEIVGKDYSFSTDDYYYVCAFLTNEKRAVLEIYTLTNDDNYAEYGHADYSFEDDCVIAEYSSIGDSNLEERETVTLKYDYDRNIIE